MLWCLHQLSTTTNGNVFKMNSKFNKVIVWGHKLGYAKTSNTFAFIHNAWYKTFKYLGYEVLWLGNEDPVEHINFDNCLFLTEGQVDDKIPIVNSSKYVLHHCNLNKYNSVLKNCLNIGTFNTLIKNRKIEQIDDDGLVYYQLEPDPVEGDFFNNRTLYQPWATDLLPHEIDEENPIAAKYNRQKKIYWVGSITNGYHGNINEISAFEKVCSINGTPFIHAKVENRLAPRAISESWLAPAIQGKFQVDIDYLPCRVFKNISYGRMPLTNSKKVFDVFNQNIVYSTDMTELYELGIKWEQNPNQKVMKDLMRLVKNKHTYVTRIEYILKVL